MKKFQLVKDYGGYVTKPEETNTSIRHLVSGSENVLINDGKKVASRNGYTLDGQANTATNGIESAFDWFMFNGQERNLRSYDDELEYRYVASDDTVTWRRLEDSFTAVDFVYTTWWNTTNAVDKLLFVNGTSNIFEWSGGITTVASGTATTITKQGTTTWAEEGFTLAGTRRVIIEGTAYTYTGGEGTTTLTGVTPTAVGLSAGEIAHQQIVTTANSSITGLPNTFANDGIAELKNQIYVGSNKNREIYISKTTDELDYSFSSPRIPGDGALLTLGDTWTAFAPQENQMYVASGKDQWYQTRFSLSDDLSREGLEIERLKTGPQQAPQSQDLTGKAKNNVIFISNEPTLDELNRAEDFITPQAKPISDPIKPDFDATNFAGGQIKYYKNDIYITAPIESKLYIFEIDKGYWQPPQIIGLNKLSIIAGELYGHSSLSPETYKLFVENVFTDDNNSINSIAKFSYRNFGRRDWQKNFDEFFTEGYISPDTTLTLTLNFDFGGSTQILESDISGSDDTLIFSAPSAGPLGKEPLGKVPLGSILADVLPRNKFRHIFTQRIKDFYELQVVYQATSGEFEIISQGPNARLAVTDNILIKR